MVKTTLIVCIFLETNCIAQTENSPESCYFINCSSLEEYKRPSFYFWNKDSSTYFYSIMSNSFITFDYQYDCLFVSDKENKLIDILKSDVEISCDFSLKVVSIQDTLGFKSFKVKLFSTVSSGFAPQYYLFSTRYGILGFKNGFGTFVNPYFENRRFVCGFLR